MTGNCVQARSTGERWPDFFIAGAAKAGTTSLWRYLLQHPQIYMPREFRDKEPSFFCNTYGIDDPQKYLELFAAASADARVGEASGPYLTAPESADQIRRVVPHARFIIMLRNPADRAYSLYNWMIKEGYESIDTFEKALEAETDRVRDANFPSACGQYHWNFLYFRSGLYSAQIRRYLEVFPRENIHFVQFETFRRNPLPELKKIFQFLEVADSFQPAVDVHNAGAVPRSVARQYFLRNRADLFFRRLLVPKRKELIRYLMKRNVRENPARPMNSKTRATLIEQYDTDIRHTAQLTGMNLQEWLSTRPANALPRQTRSNRKVLIDGVSIGIYFWAREFISAAMV